MVTTGSDRAQLVGMAQQARAAIGGDKVTVVADRGYFSGRQILACEDAEITAYVSKPFTSSAKAAGRFDRRDFIYDADRDCYRCPAGEDLVHRSTATEGTMKIRRYWTRVCGTCALKARCTPGTERRVSVAGGASTAYQMGSAAKGGSVAGGLSGVTQAGVAAATSPLRRAAAELGQRYQAGGRAALTATGGTFSGGAGKEVANDVAGSLGEPAWARSMRRRQSATHGVQTAAHALRAGDGGGSGTSISVREGE